MKILTLDIETSPHEGYTWGVWQQNIAAGQIIVPTTILTYAAKFLDKKKIVYRTWRDEDMYETLANLLNEADVIVTYNGDKFDLKHINREFVTGGIKPPRPCASVDLLQVVRKRFNFPHNGLDYVCSKLLGETKLETGGFDLWPKFMDSDPKAERVMKRYNIKDTVLTEKLYLKLRPWILNHPYAGNITVAIDDEWHSYYCPACGSSDTIPHRPRRTRCFAIRTVNCNSCGAWFDGKRRKLQ